MYRYADSKEGWQGNRYASSFADPFPHLRKKTAAMALQEEGGGGQKEKTEQREQQQNLSSALSLLDGLGGDSSPSSMSKMDPFASMSQEDPFGSPSFSEIDGIWEQHEIGRAPSAHYLYVDTHIDIHVYIPVVPVIPMRVQCISG